MAISSISVLDEEYGIYRDNSIVPEDPYRVYATNGQGCHTVWFKNVKACRKAIDSEKGLQNGHTLYDCSKCGCHYSVTEEGFTKYPMHACSDVKMAYAKSFE